MKKNLITLGAFCLIATSKVFGAYSSQIHLNANNSPFATVNQRVSSSLVITQSGGSSLIATYILEVKPMVWKINPDNKGSSVTSYAFGPPYLGSSLAGQTDLFGGSLTLPMNWRFFAPSDYPSYGSSVQIGTGGSIGTHNYQVGAVVTLSDGNIVYPTPASIRVRPIILPDSQQTGWHN